MVTLSPNIAQKDHKHRIHFHSEAGQVFSHYLNLVEETKAGARVLKSLSSDSRIGSLDGKLISYGWGAARFDINILAMWFMWSVEKFGAKTTKASLNLFLDSYELTVTQSLWLIGLELYKKIDLENGISIVPLNEMPDSWQKEEFSTIDIVTGPSQRFLKPKAALTIMSRISKIYREDGSEPDKVREKEFSDASQALYDMALLLNIIDGISCTPFFLTYYASPTMPLGPFEVCGGSCPHYDVLGSRLSTLLEKERCSINSIAKAFNILGVNEKRRIRRVLSRLSQAKKRMQIEDKILDLGIALEMALLDDNKRTDQLSLSFRLRGTWLIGKDKDERQVIYDLLDDIYKYRSQVAHNGSLNPKDANVVDDKFPAYLSIAEKIIKRLILHGRPNWTQLLLGSR